MANLKETSFWEEGIYQWETSDPVLGGENGIDNVPTRQLANRTKWLKDNKLDKSDTAANAELAKRANTADRLSDARKVGGVEFDGSADIDLPGVNKRGNQDTSGNAETASRLKTVRTINGVPFDGSTDINATPAGAVQYFAMTSAPVGWLKANGAAVSRTLYANLFASIGTRFGAGDGKTTFNLPDLRGYFLRAWDDGKNIDSGRIFGSEQGDAIRNIKGYCSGGQVYFDSFSGPFFDNGTRDAVDARADGKINMTDDFGFDASRVVPTANENRPRNIALLACIKI
ncbi:phage tail protein [Snodgrassella communis]|uniref:phage tail protein n=1 Tax=Snodgrassella communis TaxID=2946699 RepID=UPI001EF5691A|nr:phage tail protein [Snodgrassella communis]